jgi:hypothetical protein
MIDAAACELCKRAPEISQTVQSKSTTLHQMGKILIDFTAIFHLSFAVDDLLLSTI